MALVNGMTQKEAAQKAIDLIMDAVNIMGSDKEVIEGIFEAIMTSHRTLQQNFWRVMIEVIKRYSTQRHDLRNEASVNLCLFITEHLEEYEKENGGQKMDYLPFV